MTASEMTASEKIRVNKTELGQVERVPCPRPDQLQDGQVLIEIDRFGLTTNNVTYALFGDALGYWTYFPEAEGWGSVPVWGFATVTESACPEISVGERLFGILPMAPRAVLQPSSVNELAFADAAAHRVPMHPWYNRYYRCASDPVFRDDSAAVQPVLWALFMTGWRLAEEVGNKADAIYISSASSKTALSLAWSLKRQKAGARVIALTSNGNRDFVSGLGVYDDVQTYDALTVAEDIRKAVFVDVAGNGQVASDLHVLLGERLVDSVTLGATHRAPSDGSLPMPGPAPRLFFIPDVAEALSASEGFATAHQSFADAWHAFAPWASGWLELEVGQGADAIEAGYLETLRGGMSPQRAMVFSW